MPWLRTNPIYSRCVTNKKCQYLPSGLGRQHHRFEEMDETQQLATQKYSRLLPTDYQIAFCPHAGDILKKPPRFYAANCGLWMILPDRAINRRLAHHQRKLFTGIEIATKYGSKITRKLMLRPGEFILYWFADGKFIGSNDLSEALIITLCWQGKSPAIYWGSSDRWPRQKCDCFSATCRRK